MYRRLKKNTKEGKVDSEDMDNICNEIMRREPISALTESTL